MISKPQNKKLYHLEGARGVASVIVFLHHFLLGFFPLLKLPLAYGGLKWTPIYILVNGTGAVYFFFTLSGFVLTLKFHQFFAVQDFVSTVLKRLPRLMLPAGLSMLIGAAILIYLPEAHRGAAQLTGSGWLADFGSAGLSSNFAPSFSEAARNSLFVFLWPGHAQYNSNLWTMVYEFYGSLIVFSLAGVSSLLLGRKTSGVIALHLLVLLVFAALLQINFLAFVVGSLIAFLHGKHPQLFQLSNWAIIMMTLAMIAGYSVDYKPVLILASTLAMTLLLCVPCLERQLSGPIGLFLGRLSFPLYLVHLLVILSITSAAYTTLSGYGWPKGVVLALSLALTCATSLLAALPFMTIERIWITTLNSWMLTFVRYLERFPFILDRISKS